MYVPGRTFPPLAALLLACATAPPAPVSGSGPLPSAERLSRDGLVTVLTRDPAGGERGTEVYVTAVAGVAYVLASSASGAPTSRWLADVEATSEATLISRGRAYDVRAEVIRDPRRVEAVRSAMTEKYGAYEAWFAFQHAGGPAAVLVSLTPHSGP